MCVECSSRLVSDSKSLCVTCESCCSSGVGVPHDLAVTAAMLYIVVIMRTSSVSCDLEKKVSVITTDWLCGAGSPLSAFSQLSMCHAFLAKLPPSSLVASTERKSLLSELFPIISQLFDRYMHVELHVVLVYEHTCVCFTCAALQRPVIDILLHVLWHFGLQ